MKIKNAIIIHGPGKSGTTLLNDILALHADLFWISTYVNKHPNHLFLTALNNIQSISCFEQITRSKKNFPRPSEPFHFFSFYIPDFRFNQSFFDPKEIKRVQNALTYLSNFQKGKRLITKITGPSRTEFLDEVFENPYIIWMDRNPKAVITSYYKYKWRYKDKPEVFYNKPKTELIKEYADYYNWIKKEKDNLKKFRFKTVTYEALVKNPEIFFRELCIFLDLEYTTTFEKTIRSWAIRKDTNYQYKKFFDHEEIDYMDSLLNRHNTQL